MNNRIIKFRVWDKINRFWVDPDKHSNDGIGITFCGKVSFCGQSYFGNTEKSDNYEIQQFTGLLDKKGKEIYEGDIIQQSDGRFGEVEFASEQDGYDCSFWHMKNSQWGDGILGTIVIGNIFENPELLK